MNYRHAFHAGNFADLVKHAALLQLLERLSASPSPLTVIDTHAGRGLYDLAGPEAQRSGEADAGILKLMGAADAPAAFEPLKAAVARLNPAGEVRRYPGSPWLIAGALRPRDSYLACELRPAEHTALKQALAGLRNVGTLCADGYQAAEVRAPRAGRLFVLIDPPFERPDDHARIAETVARLDSRRDETTLMIWLPIKDLASFDAVLGELADAARRPGLIAEARIRPLTDPTRMNGCALALIGAPDGLSAPLEAICGWVANTLGEGGAARVYPL